MTEEAKKDGGKAKVAEGTKAEENIERNEKMRNTEANIGAASSDDLAASGAFIEPDAKASIDVDSVSVDNNPRAGTSEMQNAVDFNDPTANDSELSAERTKVEDTKDASRNEEDADLIPRRR